MKNRIFYKWFLKISERLGMGMRGKLISIFVVIKVLPLILLALVAWRQSWLLGVELQHRSDALTAKAIAALTETGEIAVKDAMLALDRRATEDIERMTTDTARRVAFFLYERDDDLRFAATLPPDAGQYKTFVQNKKGRLLVPGQWELAPDQKSWVPASRPDSFQNIQSSNKENDLAFNYRPPDGFTFTERPLYLEMTFVDLNGQERVKAVTTDRLDPALKDVSKRENTYVKAETYFPQLKNLKPGEIYVSDVIGSYVGSRVIGTYTPETAAKAGEEFNPQKSAYAGRENPLGQRFQGAVRWATPVSQNGKIIGYVTLLLDHDHIMEFTDHTEPTDQRYTEIPDASQGNYAFIWDHKGRSIVHPRHFSITGYDPQTGDPQVPWLEDRIYDAWQRSGQTYAEYIKSEPCFVSQSIKKKAAPELTRQGLVGLDCRYLNFAPQCTGWFDLTQNGGSGSFNILWSGLLKLTTAAAIPYYTGQYGASLRGFGFVTIGAGLDDFHGPANETKQTIDKVIVATNQDLNQYTAETQNAIEANLIDTASSLTVSTALMAVLVILVAIWMASFFTRSITGLIDGISRFRSGQRHFRFNAPIKDEIGSLADAFDDMADSLEASTNDIVAITDLDGKIIYINEPGLAIINEPLENVLGKPYFDYSVFTYTASLKSLAETNEMEMRFHEPTQKYYRRNVTDLKSTDGRNIGYVITTADITEIALEQKRIERQRALLNTVFDASPDLIWYKDDQGRYLAINPRFSSFIGKQPEQVLGRVDADVMPPELARAASRSDSQAIALKQPFNAEEKITFADGHTEIVDSVRTPLYNSSHELVGTLGVSRDVTHRVEIQNQLTETQIELEKAVREANQANEYKSEFLARMSHEIRTPMNAIIGMTSIVKRKLSDPELKINELSSFIDQVEISSRHLLGLLNDILDISKIEAGKIDLSYDSFYLAKLVEEVKAIILPRCLDKHIDFKVTMSRLESSYVLSDALRLRQVLINLLGNAVKFTPEHGHIELAVSRLRGEAGRALFSFEVIDDGIGISPDALENLFRPFEQANRQITKEYGGTGLGLSISNMIIKLMGGEIKVTSQLNRGSVFSFEIWLPESTPAQEEQRQEAPQAALEGKRVLLVDDITINRVIVVSLLGPTGLLIDEVDDGQKALEAFANSPIGYYQAIFMDIQMPVMDGYEASRRIRALDRPDADKVCIIAMTANAFKEDVDAALDAGMNAHLTKPLELDKIMEVLSQNLN